MEIKTSVLLESIERNPMLVVDKKDAILLIASYYYDSPIYVTQVDRMSEYSPIYSVNDLGFDTLYRMLDNPDVYFTYGIPDAYPNSVEKRLRLLNVIYEGYAKLLEKCMSSDSFKCTDEYKVGLTQKIQKISNDISDLIIRTY